MVSHLEARAHHQLVRADGVKCVKQFRAFTATSASASSCPRRLKGSRSMFAFLIAAGAVFLAVAVSAAINLAGPSQSR